MRKKSPCLEYPNCECPKCEAFRKTLDVVFTWDRPAPIVAEANRPSTTPIEIQPRRVQGMDRPRERRAGGARAWMRRMRTMRCDYCGGPGGTIDHVVPVSKGGPTRESNCVPACVPCNSFRGNRPYEQFKNGGWLERLPKEARYNGDHQ